MMTDDNDAPATGDDDNDKDDADDAEEEGKHLFFAWSFHSPSRKNQPQLVGCLQNPSEKLWSSSCITSPQGSWWT